jgi:glucose dehydrogenase
MKTTAVSRLVSRFHFSALAACLLLPAASLQAQQDFSPAALVQLPTASWPTNGGDLYNRRFSPLTEISKDNVANLKGVWRTHLNGSGMGARHSGEATPLVCRSAVQSAV